LEHGVLPVSLDHELLAGSLDIAHKDPFDRLLIAQARIEQVPIVSNEALFDGFGVERIW
jgi:PIN domain nuclease of toxin-antitoxin system